MEDPGGKQCEVCFERLRQYKCPRCSMMTCSLQCCKKHKLENGCNGQRDRAAYVSIRDFGEKTLRSDLHFLEDVLQSKDSAKRVLLTSCGGVRKNQRGNDMDTTNILLNSKNGRSPSTIRNNRSREKGNSIGNDMVTTAGVSQAHSSKVADITENSLKEENCKGDGGEGNVNNSQDCQQTDVNASIVSSSTSNQTVPNPKRNEVGGNVSHLPVLKPAPTLQHLDMYSASVKRFVKATANRGTRVILMSPGMTKRKQNSTQYRPKTDQIYWKINVVFIINGKVEAPLLLKQDLDTNGEMKVVDDAVVGISVTNIFEDTTIETFLEDFFDPRPGNSIIRHALRPLRLRRTELRCFMQKIPSPANNPVFIQVCRDNSIRKMLEDKTIIEYPTLFVGIEEDVKKFNFLVAFNNDVDEGHKDNAHMNHSKGGNRNDNDRKTMEIDSNEGSIVRNHDRNSQCEADGYTLGDKKKRPHSPSENGIGIDNQQPLLREISSKRLKFNHETEGDGKEEKVIDGEKLGEELDVNLQQAQRMDVETSPLADDEEEGAIFLNTFSDTNLPLSSLHQGLYQSDGNIGGDHTGDAENDDDEEDDAEDFVAALVELQDKDISQLQALVNDEF